MQEYIDPPPAVCEAAALLSLSRILFEFQPSDWWVGKIDNIRSDGVRFRIKWAPTEDHPEETYSLEQLLPLDDPNSMKFKILSAELSTAYDALYADEVRGGDSVRRSVQDLNPLSQSRTKTMSDNRPTLLLEHQKREG